MKLETNYVWPFTRARKLKVKMMLFGLNQKSPVENFTYISERLNVLLSHKIKNYTYRLFFLSHETDYLFVLKCVTVLLTSVAQHWQFHSHTRKKKKEISENFTLSFNERPRKLTQVWWERSSKWILVILNEFGRASYRLKEYVSNDRKYIKEIILMNSVPNCSMVLPAKSRLFVCVGSSLPRHSV